MAEVGDVFVDVVVIMYSNFFFLFSLVHSTFQRAYGWVINSLPRSFLQSEFYNNNNN